ncbi:sugar phosphate isomerase/epimerase family protein [Marinisporobacter balticus]|uniref:Sugar phosphate isomerase/epimerase n=1 Tax=Marinisporobacter balticus TaxID=2018667 RepID=A0A4R2KPR0_9FIRM|nr:sugar phosphate isomerase/epimerase [Marinisporobacter balticus]TCO74752.1 sugar phosphate isomerase/epimerase [Marinisporobacter balticus]
MKIGYAASSGETELFDTLKYTYDHGFDCVEININMPIFFPENFTKEDREKIRKYKEELAIEITMHAPEDMTLLQLQEGIRKASIDRLKEVIDFGVDIGASRMTMHVGSAVCFTLTDRKSYLDEDYCEAYKKVLKKSLIELMNHAKDRIMICVENSGRFPKSVVQETLEELLKEEHLYLTWDIGHSYTNKYEEVTFFLKHIDKIKTCHLHDHNGESDHQIIGSGNVDFNWHIDKMKSLDVYYIIEVRPRDNAVKSLEKLKKIMF